MTREEKREYLLKQFTKNKLSIYLDGFDDGFDCTYDAVKKDFEQELKAKDEEIVALKAECEYDQRNAARSQRESVSLLDRLKAKDEEIKGLGCRIYHAEGYISDLHNNLKDKKFYDKKARSIVAMLFWDMKKYDRYSKVNNVQDYVNNKNKFYALESVFKKSYKMLKDTK